MEHRYRPLKQLLAFAMALTACPAVAQGSAGQIGAKSSEPIAVKVLQQVLRESGSVGIGSGLTEEDLGGPLIEHWPDYSPRGSDRNRKLVEDGLAALKRVDRDTLSDADLRVHDIVLYKLSTALATDVVRWGYFSGLSGKEANLFAPFGGIQLGLPQALANGVKVKSVADANTFLRLLRELPKAIAGGQETLVRDVALGAVPPQIALTRLIEQVEAFTGKPADTQDLHTQFAAQVNAIPSLSDQQRHALVGEARVAIEQGVYPAYRRLAQFAQGLLPKARADVGLWSYPGGSKFYKAILPVVADTRKAPEEIHLLGLTEVKRISDLMDRQLVKLGHREGTVGERMAKLAADPQYLIPNTDEGRSRIIETMNSRLLRIYPKISSILPTVPQAPVEIRRVPREFSSASSGGGGGRYEAPSLNGSQPGVLYMDVNNTARWPAYTLPTFTYHETVPGHHLQFAVQVSAQNTPKVVRLLASNAFSEGWGLYAEKLAAELGMYDDDPAGDLGRLQLELFRAARLVVDTGMHAKKWGLQQSADYFAGVTGWPMVGVKGEMERYCCSLPGQALGYKIGMLEIEQLRAEAQARFGPRFDIRTFHDVVLKNGSVPLPLLRQNIQLWLDIAR